MIQNLFNCVNTQLFSIHDINFCCRRPCCQGNQQNVGLSKTITTEIFPAWKHPPPIWRLSVSPCLSKLKSVAAVLGHLVGNLSAAHTKRRVQSSGAAGEGSASRLNWTPVPSTPSPVASKMSCPQHVGWRKGSFYFLFYFFTNKTMVRNSPHGVKEAEASQSGWGMRRAVKDAADWINSKK